MKNYFLLLLFVPLIISRGQNLDSLFNEFVKVKGLYHQAGLPQSLQETKPIKCSFGIISQVRLNYDKFTPKQRIMITEALQRQSTDTSIVSSNQKFRIHFYKKGSYVPTYDVNELAKAADSVYNYEINILGYTPSPTDGTAGGDEKYDIYILNEGTNNYGGTTPETLVHDSTWTSFIEINYDYGDSFFTKGIDAAKVTVAHEFHHAIQIGSYIYRPKDSFYYEITATSMEDFVFDSINDYYGYLSDYFMNTSKSFSSSDGYSLAIWNFYMAARFNASTIAENIRGKNIIRRTWELMAGHERALTAIAQAIQEAGSTFKIEFNNFGIWTYFTGTRAITGKYFEEAANYPLVTPFMTLPYAKSSTSLDISSEAASNTVLVFNEGSGDTKNVLVSILSNCDISGALGETPLYTDITYTLAPGEFDGSKKITEGYYSKIKSASDFLFAEADIFNGVPVDVNSKELEYVFPQPFRYSKNQIINVPASRTGTGYGDLYVYDMGMKLVYSAQVRITATDKIVMQWNGLDGNGKKLNTGVYLYVTRCGDKVSKGKFVIFND
jgi:hypothetical protein